MDEKNDFALVPRPPTALERAGPGAKRIVFSMVAEVLVIARREASELEAMYRRGLEYEKCGEQNQALDFYKRAAERGHLWAQYKLGQCFLYGIGVQEHKSEGIAWLQKALDRGLGRAGWILGNHYSLALVPNYHEALKCYQRGVELGEERAAQGLANVQERLGKPDETTETAAVKKAAASGDPDACFEMGTRCLEGAGVSQDATAAFRWFREAAAQGDNAEAWCYMGFMLETGQGVTTDLNEAIECFRRASELGNDVAYSRLIELNVRD
jgi:TPR repeat protein